VAWSIAEVARESGVTARTLRHYDAIGLLVPAWTADNGRRYYEQEQLMRLQQILLLRNLGLGLETVAEVLAQQSDTSTVAVLVRHRDWLVQEQDRLGRLVRTRRHHHPESEERRRDVTEEGLRGIRAQSL